MKNRLELKGAVIGMLMGDAGLSKDRKNAHLQCSHSGKYEDYALWKKEILEQLTSVSVWRGESKASKESDKLYPVIVIFTKSHPFYTGLRQRVYHANRKTFDVHMLKRLDDLGLLFWYLDDGVRYWKESGNDPGAIFCTDRYNYIEHLSLQKYFHDRWNLTAKLNRHGEHWRLRFGVNEIEKLDKIFEPFISHVPDCMKYKLLSSYEAP
ncbi:MAG: hypothetical protein PHE50_00255 [Dehalococcoidales bacterium]|nr:hypothetical protein [Dehalococcoidales bacterium]